MVDPLKLAKNLDLLQVLEEWGAAQCSSRHPSVSNARQALKEEYKVT
jgi:hypothetical protein